MRNFKELTPIECWTEVEKMAPYAHDEALQGGTPLAVLFPRSTEEVVRITKFASKKKMPMIARGAGSGLSGAVVPMENALVVSFERMNRILEIRADDSIAVVEPGVITGEIRRAAEEKGLFYPPIPASVDFCTIGGNIATNAGGLCAVKYGATREYVIGLEVVLASGEVIRTGGRYLKTSTGYNLTQLIVGSEGTLGIVTQIILRLIPFPKERLTLLASFSLLAEVSRAVVAILSGQIVPPTLELIPKGVVDCVLSRHPNLRFPFPDMAASLLVELDGRNGASIESDGEILDRILRQSGAKDILVATTSSQRDEIWGVRKLARDSIANSGDFIEADSVVPRRNVPALIEAADRVAKRNGMDVISYGHAGDGNLHTYFRRGNLSESAWKKKSEAALQEFFEETLRLEGTLSGEHGIGFLKKDYMPMAFSKPELDLMRRLKKAFDPDGLLNPGKVLP